MGGKSLAFDCETRFFFEKPLNPLRGEQLKRLQNSNIFPKFFIRNRLRNSKLEFGDFRGILFFSYLDLEMPQYIAFVNEDKESLLRLK